MKADNKSWAIILIVIFVGLLMWFLSKQNIRNIGNQGETSKDVEITESVEVNSEKPFELGEDLTEALLVCSDQKRIGANFKENGVLLYLSDKRRIELRKITDNKYANESESIVFLTNTKTASLEENGKKTFENCREVQAEL
ncbi:MAG: hypothetical protein M3Q24_00870 [bacterium]|nr:hypothetical protein [bacterium]